MMEDQGEAKETEEKMEGEAKEEEGDEETEEEEHLEMYKGRRALGAVQEYPDPVVPHGEVCRSRHVFMETLRSFHYALGTRFMIPVIGGKELDLHLLYVQVTQRGGIEKVIFERRWREVIATFNFPRTTTSASYVLRKYYLSLLYHFEQVYFFGARGALIEPSAVIQTKSYMSKPYYIQAIQYHTKDPDPVMAAFRERKRTTSEEESQVLPSLPPANPNKMLAISDSTPSFHSHEGSIPTDSMDAQHPSQEPALAESLKLIDGKEHPSTSTVTPVTPATANGYSAFTSPTFITPSTSNPFPAFGSSPRYPGSSSTPLLSTAIIGLPASSSAPETGPCNFSVNGTIDAKFEHGYFVTVWIKGHRLRGVLYHAASDIEGEHSSVEPPAAPETAGSTSGALVTYVNPPQQRAQRRRRRVRYRDPAHPKPNRSAYNFFFAEKHSKLKYLYPHREREFSRMIGDSWNKLTEEEREVYNVFGRRDKERYRKELQEYRERMRLPPLREPKRREIARPIESSSVKDDGAASRAVLCLPVARNLNV